MNTYNSTYRQPLRYKHGTRQCTTAPLLWLRAGWNDFVKSPAISLALGTSFTALCFAAYTAATALPMFTITFFTLLLAASPFLAATAYAIARQHEHGMAASMLSAVNELRTRTLSIGLFSLLMALIVAVWLRFSSIAFALYFGTLGVDQAQLARTWTAGFEFPAMLVFLTIAGIALGLTLFAIGTIALPAIADRNDDLVEAVRTGASTLRANAATMVTWMVLIASLLATGLLSALVVMPILFPILAYATWHSYRDLCS